MRILFSMRHPGALRNFASTIGELAQRGHAVHLSFMMRDKLGDDRLLDELTERYPGVTAAHPARTASRQSWLPVARRVRYATDYLRYETPAYASATALRDRAAQRAPARVRRLMQLPVLRSAAGVRIAAGCLALVERAIPPDARVLEELAAYAPDIVLVTPLVELGSDQVEYVKAARALGIRSGLCVHSWDNLTNKGLIRVLPDRVFVWNEAQKREAVTMHGVASSDVVVTGAPVYDQWFDRAPSRSRAEFCATVGLRADRPFVLYLCSSQFIAPEETTFVDQWIRAVRSAPDASVREAGILVRPHPRANLRPWQAADFSAFSDVALWPRGGANPVDADSKNDYFDSLYHAAAAVGINTSAQIEAGIVGRPVYSVRAPEYAATQEGTLHFHLLLEQSGGLLHMANTLDDHVRQLAGALAGTPGAADSASWSPPSGGPTAERLRRFVQAFVRPRGLDQSATTLLADGIEQLGRLGARRRERAPAWAYPVRAGLYPFARVERATARRRTASGRANVSIARRAAGAPAAVFTWPPLTRYARRYILPRVVPRAARQAAPRAESTAVSKLIQRLAASGQPVIVGPWLNDVGFELLYWIPFLAWATHYRAFAPEQLIVVSRGGVAPWYQGIATRYVDLFDLFTPEQLRARNGDRRRENKGKHLVLTPFDREVIDRARTQAGAAGAEVLSPVHMYRLFAAYWKGEMPLDRLEQFAVFRRLPDLVTPPRSAPARDYTAVRFHFNESFPDTGDNRAFIARTVRTLADAGDVLVLGPDVRVGDAAELRLEPHPRVRMFTGGDSLRDNLEAQRQIIAGARAFVGTHGGFSHLASFQGVPSLSVYSHRAKLSPRHLELAQKVFGALGSRSYVIDTHDLALFGLGFLERASAATDARPGAAAVRA